MTTEAENATDCSAGSLLLAAALSVSDRDQVSTMISASASAL
jgi:hypothetical protein